MYDVVQKGEDQFSAQHWLAIPLSTSYRAQLETLLLTPIRRKFCELGILQGLRLHDNPAILEAARSEEMYPVFCLDPWFTKPETVGVNRMAFLLESLEDLHCSLDKRKSGLLVRMKASNDQCLTQVIIYSLQSQFCRDRENLPAPRISTLIERCRWDNSRSGSAGAEGQAGGGISQGVGGMGHY
jgi:hypothetical protein